jgi:very-short-patch-repair endonuclease
MDSVAEGAFRRAIVGAGLPEPVPQHRVLVEGRAFYLDFAWPERRVALEVDSYRWHSGPQSFSRDFVRVNRLATLGWRVLRATPVDLEANAAVVLAALSAYLASPA